MRAYILMILQRFSFLCLPTARFTASELRVLQEEYRRAPSFVPPRDIAWFSAIRAAEIHIEALLELMANHPTWVLSDRARHILNSDGKWSRRIGFWSYRILTEGADCPCCTGWRALMLAAATSAAASALTFLVLRGMTWSR